MPDRYRVIITPRAASDLEGIHRYIEQDSPQNASDVAAAIIDSIDGLDSLPHRYPVYQGRRQPSESVRRMPVPPFLVYYRVSDSNRAVHVVTIRHGKQRQPKRFA